MHGQPQREWSRNGQLSVMLIGWFSIDISNRRHRIGIVLYYATTYKILIWQ